MQLSKKTNSFSKLFSAFLKCRKNFEQFQKKNKKIDPHSWRVSEITDSENHG